MSEGADLEALLELMPFANVLGIELDAADPEEVRGRLARAPERCTAGGVMHGGAVIVVQTDMHDGDGRRIAQVTQSQAVLPASS